MKFFKKVSTEFNSKAFSKLILIRISIELRLISTTQIGSIIPIGYCEF